MNRQDEQTEALYHRGQDLAAYEHMGCHVLDDGDGYLYTFRVWAKDAVSVTLTGDFCHWRKGVPLHRITEEGLWETELASPISLEGTKYRYHVTGTDDTFPIGDPYTPYYPLGVSDVGVISHPSAYEWQDGGWFSYRDATIPAGETLPLHIYELHLDSFLARQDGSRLSFRDLADKLIPYVKYMGYTHVEILPVVSDGSAPTCEYGALFAPDPRFGTADDFCYLIDRMHQAGVGVILGWLPVPYRRDEAAQDNSVTVPLTVDFSSGEIVSLLLSNACYWVSRYHIDGIHLMNTVAVPKEFAVRFNRALRDHYRTVLRISDDLPQATVPSREGGLGFAIKWGFSWREALGEYLSYDFDKRTSRTDLLTDAILKNQGENAILSLSHEFVMAGRSSLMDKAYGTPDEKVAQFKTAYMLQMTRSGKKLMFMGCENGQFTEWRPEEPLEWNLLDRPSHMAIREYVAALNRFYLTAPELWSQDEWGRGFEWLSPLDPQPNTVAYRRFAPDGTSLWVILSFARESVTLTFPTDARSTYDYVFETANNGTPRPPLRPQPSATGNPSSVLAVEIPPMSGLILRPCGDQHTIT